MQLWTEYEGRIIAGAYPLERLLTPEGRSAFFSTSNGTGTPAFIRLIETHFDEDEILARWRQVAMLQQPHLITLRNCGQDELDGTALVYAVMEPSDANLAEVLRERALTVEETRDIAVSLVAALQTLHEHNLIHEHIEPANVLAVGETVKLRSDCIREVPEGDEGIALKARDVHDLAVVLLQSLTLRSTVPGTLLPAPFDAIIRNGMSGAWGLSQIGAALTPPPAAIKPPATPTAATPNAAPAATDSRATPISSTSPVAASVVTTPRAVRDRLVRSVEPLPPQRRGVWAGGAAVVLLVIFLLWSKFHGTPATAAAPIAAVDAPLPGVPKLAKPSAASPAKPARIAPNVSANSSASRGSTAPSISDTKKQWRVVTYTYNRQDQAQKKADTIASQHAALHPEVFTVTGHAPYLVTLGGPMTRDQASSVRDQARAAGLSSDAYIQNYSH